MSVFLLLDKQLSNVRNIKYIKYRNSKISANTKYTKISEDILFEGKKNKLKEIIIPEMDLTQFKEVIWNYTEE